MAYIMLEMIHISSFACFQIILHLYLLIYYSTVDTFKKWPDKYYINSFKRLVIQLEFKLTHNKSSEPSFLLNIINMLMPAAIIREV